MKTRAAIGAAGVLVLAGLLTGCANEGVPAERSDAPSAEPVPQAAMVGTPEILTGIGPEMEWGEGIAVIIPEGARSAVFDFACAGDGRFGFEFGDTMAQGTSPLGGHCGSVHHLAVPTSGRSADAVYVSVDEDVRWVMKATFFREEFSVDDAVTAECGELTLIYSAFVNADDGFGIHSAFGEDEWHQRVVDASDALQLLSESSATMLAAPLQDLHDAINAADLETGNVRQLVGSHDSIVRAVCAANHTEIVIHAEFGG